MKKVPFVPRSLSTIKPIASTSSHPKQPESSSKAPSASAQAILDAIFLPPQSNSTFPGASLFFPSSQETKKLPFDPFSRPKRVYRANSKNRKVLKDDCGWLIELLREDNEKRRPEKAKPLAFTSASNEAFEAIFPEAGIFDEHAALESALKSAQSSKTVKNFKNSESTTAKARLFKTKATTAEKEEVDVFKLISGGADVDESEASKKDSAEDGGLFGFTMDLPQLSRLKDSSTAGPPKDDPYNLSDSDGNAAAAAEEEAFEYDAGDDDELVTTQADDEESSKSTRKKRRAKEESEIRAVERIMKTKYNESV